MIRNCYGFLRLPENALGPTVAEDLQTDRQFLYFICLQRENKRNCIELRIPVPRKKNSRNCIKNNTYEHGYIKLKFLTGRGYCRGKTVSRWLWLLNCTNIISGTYVLYFARSHRLIHLNFDFTKCKTPIPGDLRCIARYISCISHCLPGK